MSSRLFFVFTLLLSAGCYEVELQAHEGQRDADRDIEDGPHVGKPAMPDADGSDGSMDDAGSLRAHHAACELPLPRELPDEPAIGVEYDIDLHYNAWRDLSCQEVPEVVACDRFTVCPFNEPCLLSANGGGFCRSRDGGDVPHVWQLGQCYETVSAAWKRAVCCQGGAFDSDCRTWPFFRAGKTGELCTKHSECEPGLLCQGDGRTALCTCPGVDPLMVQDGANCRHSWYAQKSPAVMQAEECRPADAEGWSVQALPLSAGGKILATTVSHDGASILITRNGSRVMWLRGVAGHWTVEEAVGSELTFEVETGHVAMGKDGRTHVVLSAHHELRYLRRNLDGSWYSADLREFVPLPSRGAQLLLTQAGEPQILGRGDDEGSYWFSLLPYSDEQPWTKSRYSLNSIGGFGPLADVRWGPDQRIHALMADASSGRVTHAILWGPEASRAALFGYDPRFVEGSSTLEWVYSGPYGAPDVTLDSLSASGQERVLFSQPAGFALGGTAPRAARTSTGELWVAYRGAVDPLRLGIWLYREQGQQHTNTLLMQDSAKPRLVLEGKGTPHVYYEAQWPSKTGDSSEVPSEIRHLFQGPCPGVRHPSCSIDRFDPMPAQPAVSLQDGRPVFDLWRDVACEAVADYPSCTPSDRAEAPAWSCDICWGAQESERGLCGTDCPDGEITLLDGACRACVPPEARASACCAGRAGVDCRAWPYASDGRPGTACARHEDCEPGLLCKQLSAREGICACPDEDPSQVAGEKCASAYVYEESRCRQAESAPAYVYESLPEAMGSRIWQAAVTPAGEVLAVTGDAADELFVARRKQGIWSAHSLGKSGAGAMAVDGLGRVHVVRSQPAGITYHQRGVDEAWRSRSVLDFESMGETQRSCAHVAVDVDEHDRPVLAIGCATDSTDFVEGLFPAGDPLLQPWQASRMSVPWPLRGIAAQLHQDGVLHVFSRFNGSRVALGQITSEATQLRVIDSSSISAAVAGGNLQGGSMEWVVQRTFPVRLTLHSGTQTRVRDLSIPLTVPVRGAPQALRKPNGDLSVFYKTEDGVKLYEERGETVIHTTLHPSAHATMGAITVDAENRLHSFVQISHPQNQAALGLRYYYPGPCP